MSDESDFFDSIIKSKVKEKLKTSTETEKFAFLDDEPNKSKIPKSDSSEEFFNRYLPSKVSLARREENVKTVKSPPSSIRTESLHNQRNPRIKPPIAETKQEQPKSDLFDIFDDMKEKQQTSPETTDDTKKQIEELSRQIKILSDQINNNNSNAENSREVAELSRQIGQMRDQASNSDRAMAGMKQSLSDMSQNISNMHNFTQNSAHETKLQNSQILEHIEQQFDAIKLEIGRLKNHIDYIEIPNFNELLSDFKGEILREMKEKTESHNINNSYIFLKRLEDLQSLIKSCLLTKGEEGNKPQNFKKYEMETMVGLLEEINLKLSRTLCMMTPKSDDQLLNKTVTKNVFDYQWFADKIINEQRIKYKNIKKNNYKQNKPTNIKPAKVEDVIKYRGQLSSDIERMSTIMKMKNAAATARSYLQSEHIFLNSL